MHPNVAVGDPTAARGASLTSLFASGPRLYALGVMLLPALFPSSAAHGAEVTDMAPPLGVRGSIAYAGSAWVGGLEEGDVLIADRRVMRHDLDYILEFSPVAGVALVVDLAHTPSLTYRYPSANTMILEPRTGSGSYLNGETISDTPDVEGTGLRGAWLGAAVAPFSEAFERPSRASWRVDLAFRPPSAGSNLWVAGPSGKRGASPGGSALKLIGAFSARRGAGNPYLRFAFIKENPVEVDLVDEAGVTHASGVELRPASHAEITGGAEIVGHDDLETGTRFAVDVFLGTGYRSWEDVASGVYLPNVLEGSRQIGVTTSDHLLAHAGLGFDYHINHHLHTRTGVRFGYTTPHRLEHVYDVHTTPESFQIGWFFELTGVGSFGPPDEPTFQAAPLDDGLD